MFGSKGFHLRLRFYDNGQTKFINVNKLLKGNLTRRHWNSSKKCFYQSAPYSDENNDTLVDFRRKYDEKAATWNGTLFGFMQSFNERNMDADKENNTVSSLIGYIIDDMKRRNVNPDGTVSGGYEGYYKLSKRLTDFCKDFGTDYEKLLLEDMTPQMVSKILQWAKSRGSLYNVSRSLHSMLRIADKRGLYDVKSVDGCEWDKKKGKSAKKYETLTSAQCSKFVSMPLDKLPKSKLAQLYRDFCVFILYSCQSACDALSLRYQDIQCINGVDHFVFKRRKIAYKQSIDCSVPINDTMREIMDRWKKRSKDGYIFPVRSKESILKHKTNNGDIKHFISRINLWLKKLGPIIGCKFNLHTYVFRHTGITHYISKGIPIIYVANLAGTSVQNCEQIYYNNQVDSTSRDKVLNALSF